MYCQNEIKQEVEGIWARRQRFISYRLGHRGCRLGIIHPEIYQMQAEAIFYVAAELAKKGIAAKPEVMIPLVGHVNELKLMRQTVMDTASKINQETGIDIDFTVGTMI